MLVYIFCSTSNLDIDALNINLGQHIRTEYTSSNGTLTVRKPLGKEEATNQLSQSCDLMCLARIPNTIRGISQVRRHVGIL